MNGVNTVTARVGKAIDWIAGVANFTDNLPRERSSQQSGAGVDIFDKKAGADNKYAPLPDPNGKNMMVDKAVIDAMGAVTETLKPPSPTDLGEKVEAVAGAVEKGAGAGQAGQEVFKIDNVITDQGPTTSIEVNEVKDTAQTKNFTFYGVTTKSGNDSTIQVSNSEEEKKKQ